MDVPNSLVDHFVMLTNAEPSVATQLLGDNGLDLEAAIASFFAIQEAGGAPAVPAPQPPPAAAGPDAVAVDGAGGDAAAALLAADEALARQLAAEAPPAAPEVRAPLPERVDQILPSNDAGAAHVRSRRAYAVDDPFLRSDGSAHGDHLAAMFRSPDDIMCREDFDAAMAKGMSEGKWLLVNMQKTGIFQCLVLNRDVWGDTAVKELIASRFVFWQRDENTEDGRRYKQFYPYADVPHVAVVDPRSGERLRVWGGDGEGIDKDVLINALVDFCDSESLDDDAAEPRVSAVARASAARTRPAGASGAAGSGPAAAAAAPIDLEKDRMETEDAQMAAAIAASMESSGGDVADAADAAGVVGAVGTGAGGGAAAAAGAGAVAGADGDDVDMDVAGAAAADAGLHGENRHTSRLLSATDPGLNHERSLRAQQDSEFEQSLQMDRAKAESEKVEAERIARVQQEENERATATASALETKRARLPPVPPVDTAEKVTELLVRLPSGKRLQRRFLANSTLGDVYDFVDLESDGELQDGSYQLIVPMPRTAFEDRSVTLKDAQLLKRAMLVVDRL